jgi:hypothetical protein
MKKVMVQLQKIEFQNNILRPNAVRGEVLREIVLDFARTI